MIKPEYYEKHSDECVHEKIIVDGAWDVCCFCGERGDLRRGKSAKKVNMEWEPIETAPKDGAKILGYHKEDGQYVCWWAEDEHVEGFVMEGDDYDLCVWPSHWMPLPPPPSAELNKGEGGEMKEDEINLPSIDEPKPFIILSIKCDNSDILSIRIESSSMEEHRRKTEFFFKVFTDSKVNIFCSP